MSERVMAIVLTFDARAALEDCLAGIRAQTRPVDDDPRGRQRERGAVADVVAATPGATLLRLPDNLGPAGGYAEGCGRSSSRTRRVRG